MFNKNKEKELKYTLDELIEKNATSDPFWKECLTKYFENLNKEESEKINFLHKISLNKSLFNEFTKEIVKPINVEEIFYKYNKLTYNIDEDITEEKSNLELRTVVEEVIGNNDPYWNEPVLKIVEEIINLPDGTQTTIAKLLNNNEYTSKQLFDIYLCVNKVCNKINIKLDFSKDNAKVDGLLYNIPFVIKKL